MGIIVDTHTHIYTDEFNADRDAVVERAKEAGVGHLVLPNIDVDSMAGLYAAHQAYPSFCSVAMGLHPTAVTENHKEDLLSIEKEFLTHSFCAVGEVGIDLYWSQNFKSHQINAFEMQVQWALKYDLPLIIHARNAFAEVYETLHKYRSCRLRGVFHCFEGTADEASAVMRMGFKIGVNGVVTFKKSALPQVLTTVGLEHLLLETDAPYLTPEPYRGRRNEPSFVVEVAAKLAKIYGIGLAEISEITSENAKKLFNFAV